MQLNGYRRYASTLSCVMLTGKYPMRLDAPYSGLSHWSTGEWIYASISYRRLPVTLHTLTCSPLTSPLSTRGKRSYNSRSSNAEPTGSITVHSATWQDYWTSTQWRSSAISSGWCEGLQKWCKKWTMDSAPLFLYCYCKSNFGMYCSLFYHFILKLINKSES